MCTEYNRPWWSSPIRPYTYTASRKRKALKYGTQTRIMLCNNKTNYKDRWHSYQILTLKTKIEQSFLTKKMQLKFVPLHVYSMFMCWFMITKYFLLNQSIRPFLCYIPPSADVQVPSFEYPWPPPELPSLLPALPPPVRHNVNILVCHEQKLARCLFLRTHPQTERNKHKSTATFKH